MSGGTQFRNNFVSLGHEHGLSRFYEPNVFRQPGLELLDPNDLHVAMVVTSGYRVNAACSCPMQGDRKKTRVRRGKSGAVGCTVKTMVPW